MSGFLEDAKSNRLLVYLDGKDLVAARLFVQNIRETACHTLLPAGYFSFFTTSLSDADTRRHTIKTKLSCHTCLLLHRRCSCLQKRASGRCSL